MGASGIKLQGAARREKAEQAYKLSIRRISYTEIGKALNISRNLTSTLVKEEQERRDDEREKDKERERAIATYEAIIESSWKRLASTRDNSLNVSGLHNNIVAAQKAIDGITGVEAPKKSESDVTVTHHEPDKSLKDFFAEVDEYTREEWERREIDRNTPAS